MLCNKVMKFSNSYPLIGYPIIFLASFYWILKYVFNKISGNIPEIIRDIGDIIYNNPISKKLGSLINVEELINSKLSFLSFKEDESIFLILFFVLVSIIIISGVFIFYILFYPLPYYFIWTIPFVLMHIIITIKKYITQKKEKQYNAVYEAMTKSNFE